MRFIKHAVDASNNAYMDVTVSEGRYYIQLAVGELHDIERCETEADLYKQYTKWEEQFGVTEDDGTFNLYEFEQAMAKGKADLEKEEQGMRTLENTIKIGNDTIEIWRYGVDDYSADCTVDGVLGETEGWSVRGTLMQVMEEVFSIYADEIFGQF